MRLMFRLLPLLLVAGCTPQYTIVYPNIAAGPVGGLQVSPDTAWNRAPKGAADTAFSQVWTLNGEGLDRVVLIGGARDGESIVRQKARASAQVPVFRANMAAQDVVSIIESYYRIGAGAQDFRPHGLAPQVFAGRPGFGFEYDYTLADSVRRKGRAAGAIADGRLYLVLFDAAATHYFAAASPGVARLVATARLSG